jgi:hypothetical protein
LDTLPEEGQKAIAEIAGKPAVSEKKQRLGDALLTVGPLAFEFSIRIKP